MKRKLLIVSVLCLSIATILVGCGKNNDPATSGDESVQSQTTGISDEAFEELQVNYAATVEAYNAVKELYENDAIKQNDDVEDVINTAASIINEMGEIEQGSLKDEDVDSLNQSMLDIIDSLSVVGNDMVDQLNGMCSLETFSMIQENYAVMVDVYNTVKDKADASDDTIQEVLTQAGEIIDNMSTIDKRSLTKEAALELNDSIVSIVETLSALVN